MKFFFTLFTILILTACSVSTDGAKRLSVPLNMNVLQKTIYIDEAFDAPEKAQIVMALRSWECSTEGIVRFDIVWERKLLFNGPNNIFIKAVGDKYPAIVAVEKEIEDDDSPPKDGIKIFIVGLYQQSDSNLAPSSILIVRSRIAKDGFKETTIHEIGHSLGMGHTDDEDTIMYPHLDKGAHKITSHDLENFCNLYWCEANELKSCNL